MKVNDEVAAGIHRSLKKFSKSWTKLDDTRRGIAFKILLICELLGGRARAAEVSDFGDNSWDNYRHGKTQPTSSRLESVATIAGVRREYLGQDWTYDDGVILVGGVDVPFEGSDQVSPLGFAEAKRLQYQDAPPLPYAPGFDKIDDRDPSGITIPSSFWPKLDVDPKNVVVMVMKGNSMSPTISDGAPIFIDAGDKSLDDGCVYFFGTPQEMLVRRVQRRMDGGIDLLADNSALHPVQRLERRDISTLVVVGRVCSTTSVL